MSFTALAALVALPLAADGIVLDGKFDDWNGVEPVIVDPADAPRAELDLGAVRASADGRYVHLQIELGATVNLQKLDGSLALIVDADADRRSGQGIYDVAGADYVVRFTATSEGRREGMGAGIERATGGSGSPYDLRVAMAPTYADRTVEIRMERGRRSGNGPEFAAGRALNARLVAFNQDGSVGDMTDPFTIDLPPWKPPAPGAPTEDPLRRDSDESIRVLSWNGERGALRKRGREAQRVLKAIDPDIVLLQELANDDEASQIEAMLENATGDDFEVLIGEGGGNLHCAVATRLPVTPTASLEPIADRTRNNRPMRAAAFAVEHDEKRILVLSTHLKCCGRIGDSSDRRRLEEVDTISAALKLAIRSEAADAVIVAGDLNLVGSKTPLERLIAGTDVDESELAVADAYQLDGRTNATWRDDNQPFLPGRLDFTLVSDSSLAIERAFILDTRDLAPTWLAKYGVQAMDTDISDHLPLVTDVRWVK